MTVQDAANPHLAAKSAFKCPCLQVWENFSTVYRTSIMSSYLKTRDLTRVANKQQWISAEVLETANRHHGGITSKPPYNDHVLYIATIIAAFYRGQHVSNRFIHSQIPYVAVRLNVDTVSDSNFAETSFR